MKKILFWLLIIAGWEAAYKIGVDITGVWKPYSFPSPVEVIKTIWILFSDNTLFIAITVSLKRIMAGYAISIGIGVLLGIVMTRVRFLDENISALILGLQALPSICWLPFAIVWFGLNEGAIIFVIVIGSVFAIAMAVDSGIKNINPLYIRAAETMGAKGFRIYRDVVIPASLPALIAGLKQGWSFAWRSLIAAEMIFATMGLGHVLMIGRDLADISQVAAVMVIIIIIGLTVDKLIFGRLEKNLRRKWGLDFIR